MGEDASDVERLCERYGPMVYRRCLRLLGDEDEAMDACQDVFVRVLERGTQARHPSSFLYRVATNLCLNRIRDRRRRAESPGDAVLEPSEVVLLAHAYQLDDAPAWERFFFVTADAPFPVAAVEDAARQLAAGDGSAGPPGLPLPRAFELIVGANHGGADRPGLRYAVADADRFARVLEDLGGVRPESAILLKQPRLGELDAALEQLRVRVSEARMDFSIGPVIGASSGESVSRNGIFAGDVVEVTVGGVVGGGVDFHVSRGCSLGVSTGYRWMPDFSIPIGPRDNYSGFELALNIGWLFGKGSAPRE